MQSKNIGHLYMLAHTDQKKQMYAHSYKTTIFPICQVISMEIYDYMMSNVLFRGQILMQSYPSIIMNLPVNIMKGTQ